MWITILFVLIIGRILIKWTFKECKSKVCLVGKTAVITGGNKGIGYETTLDLASRGCKIIVACRSNAEREVGEIIRITHNPQIRWKHLDLMSLESVRIFATEIHKEEQKIDILINNAGVGVTTRKYTKDGLQPVMQTNLFGPFLLTHLLIDLLKKPGHARVVFVSSLLAFCHSLPSDSLNYPESGPDTFFHKLAIYGNSKVGQILVSNGFAERLKPFGITSNVLHPGLINTNIYQDCVDSKLLTLMCYQVYLRYFGRTPEEGAQRTIEMAIADEYKHVSGTYWYSSNWMPVPSITKNKQYQESVWNAIENYVNLKPHERISEKK